MILLCGIPSEPPLRLAMQAAVVEGVEAILFDQHQFARFDFDFTVDDDGVHGALIVGGQRIALSHISGVYTRVTDWRLLPAIERLDDDHPDKMHCQRVHQALAAWCEATPALVLNRTRVMASNMSKPYQAQIIGEVGLSTPDTLVTNDPEAALRFFREHQRVIFKAISGERTIVTELTRAHLDALVRLPRCPVQFQAYVPGVDVRVHVVGDATYATEIDCGGVDYRYDRSGRTRLRARQLSAEVAGKCVALARRLQLPLAGIDLRFTPDGAVYCFEANPSPAYSYYEQATGQGISRAIVRLLDRPTRERQRLKRAG